MKWDKQDGSVQRSTDGLYVCVQANSLHVIAYALTPFATGVDLGVCSSMQEARERCESHARGLEAVRKSA